MTTEQREAIEAVEEFNNKFDCGKYRKSIDTVLSLIKEQQEEIENITTNYKNLIADVSMLAKELGLEEDATIDEIYTTIRILKSKRINVIEQLDCIEVKNKEIDKLKAENKDLLRKLRNRVKQVKKLEKYSLYKSEFSRLNKQLKQKDKQIDLMAEEIANSIINTCPLADYDFDLDCENRCSDNTKECWKIYFERKAENVES